MKTCILCHVEQQTLPSPTNLALLRVLRNERDRIQFGGVVQRHTCGVCKVRLPVYWFPAEEA